MDDAHVEILEAAEALRHGLQRLIGILPALADAHARRIIDDDDRDILLRLALLLDQRGIEQDQHQHHRGGETPERAARVPEGTEDQRETG